MNKNRRALGMGSQTNRNKREGVFEVYGWTRPRWWHRSREVVILVVATEQHAQDIVASDADMKARRHGPGQHPPLASIGYRTISAAPVTVRRAPPDG